MSNDVVPTAIMPEPQLEPARSGTDPVEVVEAIRALSELTAGGRRDRRRAPDRRIDLGHLRPHQLRRRDHRRRVPRRRRGSRGPASRPRPPPRRRAGRSHEPPRRPPPPATSPPRTRTRPPSATRSWRPPTPGWSPSPTGSSGAHGAGPARPGAHRVHRVPGALRRRRRAHQLGQRTTGCSRSPPWQPSPIDATRVMGNDPGGAYDRFRGVHDVLGHARLRQGFDRDGEFAVWRSQERFHSPLARWALATELHGQPQRPVDDRPAGRAQGHPPRPPAPAPIGQRVRSTTHPTTKGSS